MREIKIGQRYIRKYYSCIMVVEVLQKEPNQRRGKIVQIIEPQGSSPTGVEGNYEFEDNGTAFYTLLEGQDKPQL